MDRKECANGLELIKVAAIKLKGNFSAIFMGTFAMTTPLILILFLCALFAMLFGQFLCVSIGVVLFTIFVGPLQMGHIKYFNNVLDGKQPRISQVYSYLRFSGLTLRSIYIAGLLLLMYIIGGVLWMVPAGFAISFYSMTLFFLQKFEYHRLSLAMNECSKKMIGNRLAMFSYKLIFYFMYFLLFILAGLFMALIYKLLAANIIISWIVAICSAIVFVFMYTMVTVYFHSSNQIFFEDVLSRDEKKRQSRVKSTINSTEQIGADKKETKIVENKESVDKKVVETKTPDKEKQAKKVIDTKTEDKKATKKLGIKKEEPVGSKAKIDKKVEGKKSEKKEKSVSEKKQTKTSEKTSKQKKVEVEVKAETSKTAKSKEPTKKTEK